MLYSMLIVYKTFLLLCILAHNKPARIRISTSQQTRVYVFVFVRVRLSLFMCRLNKCSPNAANTVKWSQYWIVRSECKSCYFMFLHVNEEVLNDEVFMKMHFLFAHLCFFFIKLFLLLVHSFRCFFPFLLSSPTFFFHDL